VNNVEGNEALSEDMVYTSVDNVSVKKRRKWGLKNITREVLQIC